ncbi:MAG: efflux RND transporter periplasmic adaptor subunit [Thermodesulfobacteriota bacterium]|nr:efflux RND transporter periplasmic adaptor subunit [Thermodesulfobacteriota bacterium]
MIFCAGGDKKRLRIRAYCSFLQSVIVLVFLLSCGVYPLFAGETISVSGITEPINDVTLSLDVSGAIRSIFFKEGALLKKGQAILEVDNRLENLEVKRRKLIWESKAEVNAALERVITLKSLLESTRVLYENTGSVSKEELDEKELDYKLALAEQERLEIAEERERVEHEMAVETLRKRTLFSPINGVIIELFLDLGETCEANQALVRVVNTSKCFFVCNIEERLGRELRMGQSVYIELQTGSKSLKKKGTIAFVSPVVDPASGLLEVKVQFDNSGGEIWPGVSGFMFLK